MRYRIAIAGLGHAARTIHRPRTNEFPRSKEKPFMNDLSEADAIIAISKERNRQVVVNNQFRCLRIHRAAKEKIGSPEFGKLLFLSMHQTFVVTEKTEVGWRGEDTRRTAKEFGTHVLIISSMRSRSRFAHACPARTADRTGLPGPD